MVTRWQGGPGRIVVLGGGGLLGHKLFQSLSQVGADVWCTIRSALDEGPLKDLPVFKSDRVIEGVDALQQDRVDRLLEDLRPAVVINCIGAIKQRAESQEPITSITLNALLPHRLARLIGAWGGRLIHFSTDCVFSGNRGRYTEADQSDATDLYGKTKHLGEGILGNALVLRTSFIGREVQHHNSLLDWFLSNNHGKVKGYRRVWWSGVTSNHLADLVAEVIENHPHLRGLYQVSSGRISKHDLLLKLRDILGLDIEVEPDDEVACDRSLEGNRFAQATGYRCPSWDALIAQLASDPTPYKVWTQ
jgi:dTDP-4-dehydrorhamnose reductase